MLFLNAELKSGRFCRPCGTYIFLNYKPSTKVLGYFQISRGTIFLCYQIRTSTTPCRGTLA